MEKESVKKRDIIDDKLVRSIPLLCGKGWVVMAVNMGEIANLLLAGEEVYTYSLQEDGEEKLLFISKVRRDESGRLFLQASNLSDINVDSGEEIEKVILNFIRKGTSYRVVSLVDLEGGSRIILREFKDIEKVRLRKFVRVDTRLDYEVSFCDVNGDPAQAITVEKNRTVNISGGGFLFYSQVSCPFGCRLHIKLHIPNMGVIAIFGKVVRCNPVKNMTGIWGVAVEFIEIPDRIREKIFSYVLYVQREQIKLGVFTESDQR